MSDYHGDGMNIADQLRENVVENERLRAELAECIKARDAASAVADLNRADLAKAEAARATYAAMWLTDSKAIARARETIRELHVPGQTAWHWTDIETALDGSTE